MYSPGPPPLARSKSLFRYVDDVAIVEETENKLYMCLSESV